VKGKRIFWSALVVLLIASAVFAYWLEIARWHVATVEMVLVSTYRAEYHETMRRIRESNVGDISIQYKPVEYYVREWRYDDFLSCAIRRFRKDFPRWTTPDSELLDILRRAEFDVNEATDEITLSVRALDPKLAVALAPVYAEAIREVMEEDARRRNERALAMHTFQLEQARRKVVALEKDLARDEFKYAKATNDLARAIDEERQARKYVESHYETIRIKGEKKTPERRRCCHRAQVLDM